MGNSGWTADPDYLIVPPGASDTDPRIFIGGNQDPILAALGQTEGIVFYFGEQRAFLITVEQDGPPGNESDSGQLHIWGYSGFPAEFRQIVDITYDIPTNDVSWNFFQDSPSAVQTSSLSLAADVVGLGQSSEPASTSPQFQDVFLYGITMARGIKASGSTTVSSGAIGAETVVLTSPSSTYRAGRVYSAEVVGLVSGSAVDASGQFRLRKGTTVAGAILSTTGDTGCSVVGRNYNAFGKTYFQVVGADVTTQLCYCLTGTGGNITHFASATTPRYMIVRDETDTATVLNPPILS